VPKDLAAAAKWYRRAAEHGNAFAQFALGTMFDNGDGVAQDYVEAVRWYKRAVEQGETNAMVSLAYAYEKGRGVQLDYSEAYRWYNVAVALTPSSDDARNMYLASRDAIGAKLSRSQVSEAQKQAREWMEAFEKRKGQK
jgi:TPR repeat protein